LAAGSSDQRAGGGSTHWIDGFAEMLPTLAAEAAAAPARCVGLGTGAAGAGSAAAA